MQLRFDKILKKNVCNRNQEHCKVIFKKNKNAHAQNSQPHCGTYGGRAYRAEHKINLNYE